MHKIRCFLLILVLTGLAFPIAAQEYDDWDDDEDGQATPAIDADWEDYSPIFYASGDRTLNISIGMLIPLKLTGKGVDEGGDRNIYPGGTGSFSFNYFLSANFFVGGELSGMFAATIGENMLYMIPFGARAGYQFLINRFEFPVSFMIGAAPQMYNQSNYFGLVMKPAVAGFFRYNNDWSFGLNVQWWIVPQTFKDKSKNVTGNFLETTLSARYHF